MRKQGFSQGQALLSVLLCASRHRDLVRFMLIRKEQHRRAYVVSIQPLQNKGVNSELTLENWSKALSQRMTIHLYQSFFQVLLKCRFYGLTPNLANQNCGGAWNIHVELDFLFSPCTLKLEITTGSYREVQGPKLAEEIMNKLASHDKHTLFLLRDLSTTTWNIFWITLET